MVTLRGPVNLHSLFIIQRVEVICLPASPGAPAHSVHTISLLYGVVQELCILCFSTLADYLKCFPLVDSMAPCMSLYVIRHTYLHYGLNNRPLTP